MQKFTAGRATLRLIYTTDLHMAIGSEDADARGGLAALAPAIERARAAEDHAILCDVGDALQGSAFGEWLAGDGAAQWDVHPVYAMMNRLGVEVATLGNHDFDFGLCHLDRAVDGLAAPMVCANLERLDGGTAPQPFVIQTLEVADNPLRVAFTGVLPVRMMRWNRHHLAGKVTIIDPADAVEDLMPQMRAAGADLVVVLAHTGIAPDDHPDIDEQAALRLGRIDGVDALLCGHQHLTFPGPDIAREAEIDPVAGLLAGTPAIMPGWAGQRAGALDLELAKESGGWSVTGHKAHFLEAEAADPALLAPVADLRARHAGWEREVLSETPVPLSTDFGSVMDCTAVRLIQSAMRHALSVSDHPRNLPVLAAASPGKIGGRSGPGGYTRLEAGPLTRRAVGELCPFPNRISMIRANGDLIRRWLELACEHLNVITPGTSGQNLINPQMPGYNFDSIHGLHYQIDPTRPVGQRIGAITRAGREIRPDEDFAVLVSSFRAHGGGGFTMLDEAEVLAEDLGGLGDAVERFLRDHDRIKLPPPAWHLVSAQPVTARLHTGHVLMDGVPPHVHHLGEAPEGWVEWDVVLGPDQSAA